MNLRISMFLGLSLLVSACAGGGNLELLRETSLPDDPYHATLAAQYLTLAEAADVEGRYTVAQHFADKGMAASYGQEVQPETPDTSVTELAAAHRALTGLLTPNTRRDFPKPLANAVIFFDCWALYQGGNPEGAALCKEGFNDALQAMKMKTSTSPLPSAQDVPADVVLSTSYLVFFGWDQASLNTNAQDAIAKVLAYVKQLKNTGYEIIVNGHTDSSGDEMYNLTLSNARADVVKEALIEAGLQQETITTYGFGESDPRVATPDNTREPANRRVEIFIE